MQHFTCHQVASIDYAEASVERVPDMVVSVIFRNGQIQNFSSKTGLSKLLLIASIETCARRRQLGWFVSGLPWGIEPHDIPIGEQWGGR